MYGAVVLGIEHSRFEAEIAVVKAARAITLDVELSAADLRDVVARFKTVYACEGNFLPQDPLDQLRAAICAVFSSWETPRAVKYRQINRITGLKGTAVNVQSMVYGNRSDASATGVCFTRNPSNGEPGLYGEFLVNAQGEDVVAGIRTPLPVAQMAELFPKAHADLVANTQLLERHLRDMQDCEFTVEEERLWMLQTRNGKRTGAAALKVALDMEAEGLVTKEEAVLMVEPRHLEQLLVGRTQHFRSFWNYLFNVFFMCMFFCKLLLWCFVLTLVLHKIWPLRPFHQPPCSTPPSPTSAPKTTRPLS
jgi:pyruvate, orthophosphate dikinase